MPSVEMAMRRSLREGFVDLLVASLRPALQGRNAITNVSGQVTDVRTAFSSWDKCMEASFCKWPVIAVIVIGGLIIFSVLWCVIRCACCGLSCCCECFHCLKCCGDCCGCCTQPGGRKHKYLDEPFIPPNQGYRPQHHMFAARPPPATDTTLPALSHASAASESPQYARFSVQKKGTHSENDDSLPAMPSWEGSDSKKIWVEEESVEMSDLKKPEAESPNQAPTLDARLVSPASSTGPLSPFPYGLSGSTAGSYRASPSAPSDAYGQHYGQGYSFGGQWYPSRPNSPYAYGQQSAQGYFSNQGYGAATPGGAMVQARLSPQPYSEQGGGYRQQGGYDAPVHPRSPDGYSRHDRNGADGSVNSYETNRPLTRAPSERQYPEHVQLEPSPFSPANGGFDFGTENSRPVAHNTRGFARPSSSPHVSRQAQMQQAAYDRHRMYPSMPQPPVRARF